MQTLLIKKPGDGEILDLIDVECVYPGIRSGECTAPQGYKCPYRQYKTSLPRAQDETFPIKEQGPLLSRSLRITPDPRKLGSEL